MTVLTPVDTVELQNEQLIYLNFPYITQPLPSCLAYKRNES